MSYSLGRGHLVAVTAVSAFFIAVTIGLTALVASQSITTEGFFLLLIWLILPSLSLWQYLFRIAYELRANGDSLAWKAPLRSGAIPLAEIREIRCRMNWALIKADGGRRIRVFAAKGFVPFARALAERFPAIQVRASWGARFVEVLPGTRFFRG
jgi:hypothetical protein